MKVTIKETMFQKMLNAIKSNVPKDMYNNPALNYIRLKIEDGWITAMVYDGISGARFKFEAQSHDGEVLLDVPTEYGNLTYHFKQKYEWNEKLDNIFDKMKVHDREIGVNAAVMARIMNNVARVSEDANKCVIIETKESQTEGFRMCAKDKSFEFEQFLLPLRIGG